MVRRNLVGGYRNNLGQGGLAQRVGLEQALGHAGTVGDEDTLPGQEARLRADRQHPALLRRRDDVEARELAGRQRGQDLAPALQQGLEGRLFGGPGESLRRLAGEGLGLTPEHAAVAVVEDEAGRQPAGATGGRRREMHAQHGARHPGRRADEGLLVGRGRLRHGRCRAHGQAERRHRHLRIPARQAGTLARPPGPGLLGQQRRHRGIGAVQARILADFQPHGHAPGPHGVQALLGADRGAPPRRLDERLDVPAALLFVALGFLGLQVLQHPHPPQAKLAVPLGRFVQGATLVDPGRADDPGGGAGGGIDE
jgi:hypothetical protein